MRAIRFRAWDRKTRSMLYEVQNGITMLGDGGRTIQFPFGSILRETDRFVTMEFTGLKDMTGRDIFEGDVVRCYTWFDDDPEEGAEPRHDFTDHEVVWGVEHGYPAFDLEPPNDRADDCNALQIFADAQPDMERIEVLGNVWEKPELRP